MQDGPALAEHAVGEQAAEDRRQIDEADIGAEDRRGERLAVEAAVERARKLSKKATFSTLAGQQQIR